MTPKISLEYRDVIIPEQDNNLKDVIQWMTGILGGKELWVLQIGVKPKTFQPISTSDALPLSSHRRLVARLVIQQGPW